MANTFKRKTSRGVGTSLVSVGNYVVGVNTQVTAIGMSFCNITDSPITVTAVHNDGADSTHIVYKAPVPVGSTLIVIGGDQKIVMEPGDSIQVQSSVANSVDSIVSFLEVVPD